MLPSRWACWPPRALLDALPGAMTGELAFLSVIEEECTGNGTLAAAAAGELLHREADI